MIASQNADLHGNPCKTDSFILKLEGVSKKFGGIDAVRDFNLQVKEGDLHCLIGPNGAGKTTIFKIITGMYPVTEGEIIYDGKIITKMPSYRRIRKGISIKMQIPGVFNDLRLRDNLRISIYNFLPKNATEIDIEDEIDRLISFSNIEDLGNPIVGNLSHGQQQWLEIAMALASKPKLLLLDELAAGFGPDETDFTASIVKKLNDRGLTILFIDHDMNFVRKIAKSVTVMHNGGKFAEGTMQDIEANEEVKQIYLGKA